MFDGLFAVAWGELLGRQGLRAVAGSALWAGQGSYPIDDDVATIRRGLCSAA